MSIFHCNKVLVAKVNCSDLVNHYSNVVLLSCCWLIGVVSVVLMTAIISEDACIPVFCNLIGSIMIFYFCCKRNQNLYHLFPTSVVGIVCEYVVVIGTLTPWVRWCNVTRPVSCELKWLCYFWLKYLIANYITVFKMFI